ncbi:ATP-dependent Clp protease proteolytic subunit [Amycolatopsis sp. lyj-112]|uniref:ATP-dependent Clp protease proteolytic subunit n=1 Tax=Amycolatopsis sp. lyj-112 TaxID=2789288 RepID=UPI00397BA736
MTDERQRVFNEGSTFYVLGEFDDDMRNGLVVPLTEKINELASQRDAVIDVWVSSTGGDAFLCMDLVQRFELAKSRGIIVRTIVTSHAYSAGSMLAVTGTPGERYIASSAEHLIHYGTQWGYLVKSPREVERNAQHQTRWFETCVKHYERYAKVPKLRDHLRDDLFFVSADDAIAWKLADKELGEL